MRVRPVLLALVAAALTGAAACASQIGTAPTAAPAATGTTASPGAVPTGAAVPATLRFTATTLDGASFDGAGLAGRPALLWFWAPWCSTCAAEAGQVSRLAASQAGKVTVVGVAGLDDRDAMRQFVTRTKVGGFPQLADESGQVWRHFGVTAQATYVLLDAAGAVLHAGYLDDDELAARVARMAG